MDGLGPFETRANGGLRLCAASVIFCISRIVERNIAQLAEEIGMIGVTTELAVCDHLQACFFLQTHRLFNGFARGCIKLSEGDFAAPIFLTHSEKRGRS